MIITIDGPAASGKSTVAQRIAQKLGIFYLNSGLLYRALTYIVLQDSQHEVFKNEGIDESVVTASFLNTLPPLEYDYRAGQAFVSVRGVDITALCYSTPGIDTKASRLSALPVVRAFLLELFRSIAAQHDLIADGRDCGTIIFPHAQYKFYLTASSEVRARRRLADPKVAAQGLSFDQVHTDLVLRDERDKNRAIAPLVVPPGACVIDSSDMTLAEVVSMIEEKIEYIAI